MPGGTTAAGVEAGPGKRLSGPGVTGRDPGVASYDVADFPIPTGREEVWRFTPLARLRGLLEDRPADGTLDYDGPGLERVTREDPRVGSVLVPTDRVAAIALARTEKPVVLAIPAETTGVETVITVRGTAGISYSHLVLDVGRFAEATVVLDHSGTGVHAANVEILVGDGASLTVVSVQDWDKDAVHAAHHVAQLGRDSTLRHIAVTLGGDLVRLVPRVSYTGPGGDAELLGLYFADAGQHLEHRLLVDHTAPRCKSRVTYKGALQGEDAHTVWVGDVVIRPAAVGTDTYELNRNLLLTDGTRADSIPNLEIETGEVEGAGHASATGRFDDEQLFYLASRGIPEEIARRLVVRGFFADLIGRIGLPAVQERLTAAIDAELERVRL